MNQSTILKKKGSNTNKTQSPLKNRDVDMQYRSSVELVNTFKIKRELVTNELNNKSKKEHATIVHKIKNFEDFIPQQGKSKLFGHKSVIESSSKEELSTSHMIAWKGQNKPRLFQSRESIQKKGIKLPMHYFRFQTSSKEGVTAFVHVNGTTIGNGEEQHDIQDLLIFKQVKKRSFIPATVRDQFEKQQGIVIGSRIDKDECAIDKEVGIDCRISKKKKVRAQTTCKNIHAKNLEESEEVTLDKGQVVGPTYKIVSELTNFIETIARNSRFINSVTVEDMLAKHPDDISDVQFCQLIEYWKHPIVQCLERSSVVDLGAKSVTTSSLKEDEETNNLKQKHVNEISSLKEDMNEMREEMRQFLVS
ncbi:hypothetical protein H5410_002780 [Solanum commersonii]|uniref:Uncharacterized protein n=1 Tax=Solanum commersonii TaxID=4109 RepID=A0A9J6B3U3_SOLCO|nr:hypothetical protein H5410_002780 [Solanum commersonii]